MRVGAVACPMLVSCFQTPRPDATFHSHVFGRTYGNKSPRQRTVRRSRVINGTDAGDAACVGLRARNFPERRAAVFCPAALHENGPAAVGRQSSRLEHVPPLLPDAPARRLLICAP